MTHDLELSKFYQEIERTLKEFQENFDPSFLQPFLDELGKRATDIAEKHAEYEKRKRDYEELLEKGEPIPEDQMLEAESEDIDKDTEHYFESPDEVPQFIAGIRDVIEGRNKTWVRVIDRGRRHKELLFTAEDHLYSEPEHAAA